jgi:copper(I)-binding protein
MKIRVSTLASFILISLLAACSSSLNISKIEIQDPWIRAVGAMDMSADTGNSNAGSMNAGSMNAGSMDTGTMASSSSEMSEQVSAGSMIGTTGAAFMTIKNSGKETDRLVAVNSDVADAVEIHLSEMKDDVMTMRPVEGVDVPAGGEAVLAPGGYHVMLIGLKRELVVGEKVNLTLTFEKAGQMSVEAEVRALP